MPLGERPRKLREPLKNLEHLIVMLAIHKFVGEPLKGVKKMSDEEQRLNQEVTQGEQKPPSKPVAKPRHTPAYWITFVLLTVAIFVAIRLFIGGGTIIIAIGPIVAALPAWFIASRLFPPVKE